MARPLHTLLEELGVPVDAQLLELALTHRSWAFENNVTGTNERLEFLGDAVLELVTTEYLFTTFPDYSEGQMAKIRAAVVSAHSLAQIGRELELGSMVRLGRGEQSSGGAAKTSILADTVEAIIGAIRLSPGGLPAATVFIEHLCVPRIQTAATLGPSLDWKTSLQERAAALGRSAPVYELDESGPDHARVFVARALIDGQCVGTGRGTSKRMAQVSAAAEAFAALTANPDPETNVPADRA